MEGNVGRRNFETNLRSGGRSRLWKYVFQMGAVRCDKEVYKESRLRA